MPIAKLRDVDLYYECHGQGPALLLIRGLGSHADHWYSQVPDLSRHFTTIVFDNRGMGRSGRPPGPYSTAMMAQDAKDLLDVLTLAKCHVLGLSMGGMVAQRLALDHPDRVAKLILACTHSGGTHAVAAPPQTRQELAEFVATASPEAAARMPAHFFARRTLAQQPELVSGYQAVSRRYPASAQVLQWQMAAIVAHDAWDELPRVKSPTLVITGDEDVTIPPANSEVLAKRIPNARLEVVPGAGHQVLLEQAAACNRLVLDFLAHGEG